ncbi:MAG: helix-turn-helix domain-containing protein [Pseudobdellovibrionaceae bacterium]|nr:helix-turn-helix domain-containing protein [Pseudobdellovibrionaceae bacterium]
MIRNDEEYKGACIRLKDEKQRMLVQESELRAMGLNEAQIKKAMEPMQSFHLQLSEEIEDYERLKRGDLGEVYNLHGLGRMLIALRIARGITQSDLAKKLDVHVSQVSRDERNEYHGVTVERASRVLDILNAGLRSRCQTAILPDLDPGKPTSRVG